jgi:hypothetical protein
MTETYHVEELDHETREYLSQAKAKKGKGMPGIFAGGTSYLPLYGMLAGFGIMVATVLFSFPPTLPPAKEAFLQTAGFLLGGWLVVAALRIWMASSSGKYAGHFVYADSDNLYEAKGGVVQITDIENLREAKAVQNFNEGNYQNTLVTLKIGHDRRVVQIKDEERGRRMTVFLNALCYIRDGGEDGRDKELQRLSPEAMGAVAKEVARTGEFPNNLRSAEEAEVARVPRPKREGRRSTGFLAILITAGVGAALFFGFRTINRPLRDEAVFAQINSLPQKEKIPGMRLYLSNPDFKAHRAEAQKTIDDAYDAAVRNTVKGDDADLNRGLSETILSLKTTPPVATLIAVEEESPPGFEVSAASREEAVRKLLADTLGYRIGDEFVVFATPADPDKPNAPTRKARGMIDVRWKFHANGSLTYTIEFRNSTDGPVTVSKQFTLSPDQLRATKPDAGNAMMVPGIRNELKNPNDDAVRSMAFHILKKAAGTEQERPPLPPEPLEF